MTTMTEANIKLGVVLAGAEAQQSSLSAEALAANGLIPDSIETGMAAQAIATGAIGKEVAGWKIAMNNGRAVAAPLLDLYDTAAEGPLIVPKPGAVAVEIEICFVLANDLPALPIGRNYTREVIIENIASVHLGAELVSYRLVEENKAPFPLFLADRLGNHSFVLGPEIQAATLQAVALQSPDLPALTLEAGGDILFAAVPKHPQVDPLAPLVAYANAPIDNLGGLKRGQVITTGSLCGLLRLSDHTTVKATWADIGALEITLPV